MLFYRNFMLYFPEYNKGKEKFIYLCCAYHFNLDEEIFINNSWYLFYFIFLILIPTIFLLLSPLSKYIYLEHKIWCKNIFMMQFLLLEFKRFCLFRIFVLYFRGHNIFKGQLCSLLWDKHFYVLFLMSVWFLLF